MTDPRPAAFRALAGVMVCVFTLAAPPARSQAVAEEEDPAPVVPADVRLLTPDEAAARFASNGDFFDHQHPNAMRAFVRGDVPGDTLVAQRAAHLEAWAAAVGPQDDNPAVALDALTQEVHAYLLDRWPGLAAYPWRFIALDDAVCGLPHTHGDAIVFPARLVDAITYRPSADDALRFVGLFVHEQLHVIQRAEPEAFDAFYADGWGFVHDETLDRAPVPARDVGNPDGPDTRWLLPIDEHSALRPMLMFYPGVESPEFPRDIMTAVLPYSRADADSPWTQGFSLPLVRTPAYVEAMGGPGYAGAAYHPNEALASWFDGYAARDFRAWRAGEPRVAWDDQPEPVRVMLDWMLERYGEPSAP